MEQRTNIIDNDEVARAMAMASTGKTRVKDKKPTARGGASGPAGTKTNSVLTARDRRRAATAASPNQASEAKYYEANGLKTSLYDQDGAGKRKKHARLAKSLLNKSSDQLLDIVEQYAGADKRQEVQDKVWSKTRLAEWIEEKETLALGRNPRSNLPSAEQNESFEVDDNSTPPHTLIVSAPSGRAKAPSVAAPALSVEKKVSFAPTQNNGIRNQSSHQKRRASHDEPHKQPPRKLQKQLEDDVAANQSSESTERPIGDNPADKPDKKFAPTSPQTSGQTKTYKDTELDTYRKHTFMHDISMDASDPGRSTMIVRGRGEDRVLTATPKSHDGEVYLFDTAVAHNTDVLLEQSSAPFLKEGSHGHRGDFVNDPGLRKGRGHQVAPGDDRMWHSFITARGIFYREYPYYPNLARGVSMDEKTRERWGEWQKWYYGFVKKYPGYAVAHLWPCGCEKVSDECESEED